MSYYRRGYNWETISYLSAPTGGWAPDIPWHELPPTQALILDNFLIKPGRIALRGGFNVVRDLTAYTPLNTRGYVLGDNAPATSSVQNQLGSASDGATFIDDSSNGGNVSWAAPANAGSLNALFTTATATSSNTFTNYLNGQGFGFTIPSTATIKGIQVGVAKYATGGYRVVDTAVKLIKAGAVTATNRGDLVSNWSTAEASSIYPTSGSTTDLWGSAWTPADINAAGFGVAISAVLGPDPLSTANIDVVQIRVYFTTPSGSNSADTSWCLVGRKAIGTQNTVDHWDVPLVRPGVSTALGVGTGTGVWFTAQSDAALATLNPTPGPRWINFDGLLYGISYDDLGTGGTATDANANYITWKTKLLTMPILQNVGTVPTIRALAPQGAYDIAGHQSRIWLLGGIDTPGAGTTHSSTTLFFTVPGSSGIGAATADWQDPVSGLTNQITMDKNTHDFGVALAKVRTGLLVFRHSSVWILRGSTTSSYALSLVSKEYGCIDARSVVETDQGVYFLGLEGLMLTDGVMVKNVSGNALLTLQAAIAQEQSNILAGVGGYATMAIVPDGKILISIGTYDVSAGIPTGKLQPIWSGMFDRSQNAWSRVTSQLWTSDAVQAAGTTNLYPGLVLSRIAPHLTFALGDKYFTDVSNLARGSASSLYDQLPSGATPFVSIPAVWKTRPSVEVGTTTLTRKFGQPKRYFLDYVFGSILGALYTTTGWQAVPVNSSDAAYSPALAVPVSSSASQLASSISVSATSTLVSAKPLVQRVDKDFVSEIDDLGFDISWSDIARVSYNFPVIADIYGIGVEHQSTRDFK